MLTGKIIGFLGAGAIAQALVQGLIEAGLVGPEQLMVTNRSDRARLEALVSRWGVHATAEKRHLVAESNIVVVAAKPQDVAQLFSEVGGFTRPGQVVLTLAAGVSTASLIRMVAPGVQVVRAMPNTSCKVRESATAYCLGPGAGAEAGRLAEVILGAVGKVVQVPEPLLDAVTGLSGSGPAYIYLVVEALIEAGTRVGLPRDVAETLSVQTVLGAARMLAETGADPGELRARVTSPGGTTMAGLQVLSERGFSQALVSAVARATERSQELGRGLAGTAPGQGETVSA